MNALILLLFVLVLPVHAEFVLKPDLKNSAVEIKSDTAVFLDVKTGTFLAEKGDCEQKAFPAVQILSPENARLYFEKSLESLSLTTCSLPTGKAQTMKVQLPEFPFQGLHMQGIRHPDTTLIRLQFSHAVAREELRKSLEVETFHPHGYPDFSLLPSSPSKEILVRLPLSPKQVTLRISSALRSVHGDLLGTNWIQRLEIVPQPKAFKAETGSLILLDAPRAVALEDHSLGIRIYLPEWPDDFTMHGIEVSPDVSLTHSGVDWNSDRWSMNLKSPCKVDLKGSFSPGETVKITLKQGFSIRNNRLPEDQEFSVTFPDLRPGVRFLNEGHWMSSQNARISLETLNLKDTELILERLLDQNQRYYASLDSSPEGFGQISEIVGQESFAMSTKSNHWVTQSLDLLPFLKTRPSGMFRLKVLPRQSEEGWIPQAYRVFQISNMIPSLILGQKGGVLQVLNLMDASPAASARVIILNDHNEILQEAVTDTNGLCSLSDLQNVAGILVEASADRAILTLREPVFQSTRREEAFKGFFFAERSLYRTEDHLNALFFLRRPDGTAAGEQRVRFLLRPPRGPLVLEEERVLSSLGTERIQWQFLSSMPSGIWTLEAWQGDSRLARKEIRVADFTVPNLKLEASAQAFPGRLKVESSARLRFGPPAEGQMMELEVETLPALKHPGLASCRFGTSQDSLARYSLFARGVSNSSGQVSFDLPIRKNPLGDLGPFTTEIALKTLEDGRETGTRALAMTAASSSVIAICEKAGRAPYYQKGKRLELNVKALTFPDLEETGSQMLWQWQKSTWQPVADANGVLRYDEVWHTLEASEEVTGPLVFLPEDAGEYRLKVEDLQSGDTALYEISVYGHGADSTHPDTEGHKLEFKLLTEPVLPGSIAEIQIRSPMPGRLLIAASDTRHRWHHAFEMDSFSSVLEIPVPEDSGPTMEIVAQLVRPGDREDSLHPLRIHSGFEFFVERPGSLETLRLSLPDSVRPDQPLELALPVAADFSGEARACLVNRAIWDLQGFDEASPLDAMRTWEASGYSLFDPYDSIPLAEPLGKMIRFGGDTPQQRELQRLLPPDSLNRKKRPLAFCLEGRIQAGEIRWSLPLPPFQGQILVQALVIEEARLQYGTKILTVRDPVSLTATLPRILRKGDQARVRLNLSRTTEMENAELKLVPNGTGLDLPKDDLLSIKSQEDVSGAVEVFAENGLVSRLPVKVPVLDSHQILEESELLYLAKDQMRILSAPAHLQDVSAQMVIYPSLQSVLEKMALQLSTYSWNCAEQTAARLAGFFWLGRENQTISRADQQRLGTLIRRDGTLSPWIRSEREDRKATLLSADLFRSFPLRIPKEDQKKVFQRLQSWLASKSLGSLEEAWAASILKLSGRLTPSRLMMLYKDSFRGEGRIVIEALAYEAGLTPSFELDGFKVDSPMVLALLLRHLNAEQKEKLKPALLPHLMKLGEYQLKEQAVFLLSLQANPEESALVPELYLQDQLVASWPVAVTAGEKIRAKTPLIAEILWRGRAEAQTGLEHSPESSAKAWVEGVQKNRAVHGSMLTYRIQLKSPQEMNSMILEFPLPAGLESDGRLEDQIRLKGATMDQVEERDGHIAVFFHASGTVDVSLPLRATIAGEFQVPALEIRSMEKASPFVRYRPFETIHIQN